MLAGSFGSMGGGGSFGPLSIPFLAQKAVTSLVRTLTILSGRDELSSDPVVQKLQGMIQQSGLVSINGLAAEMKLKEIYEAREQIGKSQIAYEVYKTFGNQAQMEAAHQQAEEARKKLKSMGISEVQYQPGKDLSGYYKQSAIKACDYDPTITDKKEEYALLAEMDGKGKELEEVRTYGTGLNLQMFHQVLMTWHLNNPNSAHFRGMKKMWLNFTI